MSPLVYIVLGLCATIGVMFGWRQYTAKQRDVAVEQLIALRTLGEYQSMESENIDMKNGKLKEELDEKFRTTIDNVNANGVSNVLNESDLSHSIRQLSKRELQQRLIKAEVALKIIHEWRNRVRG